MKIFYRCPKNMAMNRPFMHYYHAFKSRRWNVLWASVLKSILLFILLLWKSNSASAALSSAGTSKLPEKRKRCQQRVRKIYIFRRSLVMKMYYKNCGINDIPCVPSTRMLKYEAGSWWHLCQLNMVRAKQPSEIWPLNLPSFRQPHGNAKNGFTGNWPVLYMSKLSPAALQYPTNRRNRTVKSICAEILCSWRFI